MFWKQGNKAVYRKSNSINDTLFQANNVAYTLYKKTVNFTGCIRKTGSGTRVIKGDGSIFVNSCHATFSK